MRCLQLGRGVFDVPLRIHRLASVGDLPSVIFCDRKAPLVLEATDEPILFPRFVRSAACAHVQLPRVPSGAVLESGARPPGQPPLPRRVPQETQAQQDLQARDNTIQQQKATVESLNATLAALEREMAVLQEKNEHLQDHLCRVDGEKAELERALIAERRRGAEAEQLRQQVRQGLGQG